MVIRKLFAGVAISLGLALSFNPCLVNTAKADPIVIIQQDEEKKSDLEKILQIEPGVKEYLPLIEKAVKKYEQIYNVDPLFIIALLKAETYNFDKDAISWAGAAGLAQIISETAKYCGLKAYDPDYIHQAREDRRTSYSYRNQVLQELNKPGGSEIYIAKKGDNLSKIAKKKGKSLKEILDVNPQYKDNPDDIDVGDEIIIPGSCEESVKRIMEYKKQYLFYKKKADDAFKKYKEELKDMTRGKTEDELRQIDERFIPEVAIDFCVKHIADLLRTRNGDLREAASAYNAGLGAVSRYGGIPPYDETVKYQNKIINYYRRYKAFMDGKVNKLPVFLNLDGYEGNRIQE